MGAMTRERLTREDSRDRTRQRLLEAAQKLIARKGLSAASVENIAAAAGYTRGAFYSNFEGKGDLFIELLRRDHQKTLEEFDALRSDDLSLDHIQGRVRDLYAQVYRDNECFMIWTEARMLAARDAKFRAKLNALLAEKREQIAVFIEYFYRRAGVAPPIPPAVMATGFMGLVDGMKLSTLSGSAEVTPGAAESVLTLFVDSIMRLARLQGSGRAAAPLLAAR